ncbi:hypothetical protein C1645_830779 [Glomus cerebriforme]|uniref:Uncharacterized protein n=1 Tax=Glomus cerebriforme TaxID=658196 RepID=A0A397SN18_9GLOM|nr:hypothetical protein C1645_830779 [Glomus cerebriforme]
MNQQSCKLAKNVNSIKKEIINAQFNLVICYMDGLEIQKDTEKAFEWVLKSEQRYCYGHEKGTYKNERKHLNGIRNQCAEGQYNLATW